MIVVVRNLISCHAHTSIPTGVRGKASFEGASDVQEVLQGVQLSSKQRRQQRLSRNVQVISNISEYSIQRTNPERRVTGNRDMMLASLIGSQAHMVAGLACYLGVVRKQLFSFVRK